MSTTTPSRPGTKGPGLFDDIIRRNLDETSTINAIKLCLNMVYFSQGIDGVERYLAGEREYLRILDSLMRNIRKETTRGIDIPRVIKKEVDVANGIIRVFILALEDVCFKEWYRSHPAPVSAPVSAPVPVPAPVPDTDTDTEEGFGNYWDVEIPEDIRTEILGILNMPRDPQETDLYTAFSNRLKKIIPFLKRAKIKTSKIKQIYQFIDTKISQNGLDEINVQAILRFIGVNFLKPPLELDKIYIKLRKQFN